MDYIKRVIDEEIDQRSEVFGAINIVGPKGCGKTRTATERAKTVIAFEDQKNRKRYLEIAKEDPTLFLINPKPILFDEWQDAPEVWDMVRWEVDMHDEAGQFYLTGSSGKKVETAHTGTGRITTLKMNTMSLLESGESNGSVSLSKIFNDPNYQVRGQKSSLSLEDLFYLTCRGGWPNALKGRKKDLNLLVAEDYCRQIYDKDISAIDDKERNPEWAKAIMRSFARNNATPAKSTTIFADVKANADMSESTFSTYVNALERLYVIKQLSAWSPNIRSKSAIRSTTKKIFYDPSIATAILGIRPAFFYRDLNSFGHFFENLVIRDLMVYSASLGASIYHYRDDYGLECDAIIDLPDGRYALVEIKSGNQGIAEGEESLLKLNNLIKEANKKEGIKIREPDHLIIIVGNLDMAYTKASGVKVIPFGALGI